jgi:type III pantothenate kinase
MTQPDQVPGVLACDVGNSSIHFAHVCGDDVTEMQRMRLGELAGLGEALRALWETIPEPRKIVACSVMPAGLKALEAAAQETLKEEVLLVGRNLPLPIAADVADPQKVGADRLCAAVAAYDRLGKACVVGDFGTAITIDCVNDEGVFLGGSILPGLRMGARGLHQATAQLPEVELAPPDWVFGKDTRQAIVGGLVYGARGALQALVESYATELAHWPLVILTGGDAELVAGSVSESGLVQAVVPDLCLRGVAMAYYNSLLR